MDRSAKRTSADQIQGVDSSQESELYSQLDRIKKDLKRTLTLTPVICDFTWTSSCRTCDLPVLTWDLGHTQLHLGLGLDFDLFWDLLFLT